MHRQFQRRFKYRVFIKETSLNKNVYIYAPSCFVASALGLLEGFVLAKCPVSIAGNKSRADLLNLNVGTTICQTFYNFIACGALAFFL